MEINNNRKDWALEKLGDFADYEKGKKSKNQSPIQTEIFKYPYVNIQAFEKGIIDEYTDGEKCNFCSENDFLMVWDGSRFGLIGKGIKGAIGSTLMKINFPGIENHFAYYFLKSKYLEINSKPKGTGTPHVNPELLWNYIFPIAPLPEQRAIVSKIEQLFSDLDNGIENFKKAQAQLKLYRQSVLKAACEGKLVPTEAELARAQGRDYEAADVLLERIMKERREKSNGAKYKELAALDTSGLPTLPAGWCWTRFEELLVELKNGYFAGTPNSEPPGLPILRINAVRPLSVSFNDLRYLRGEMKKAINYQLRNGDLLFTRYNGSLELGGACGMVRRLEVPIIYPDKLIRARVFTESITPDYLELYFTTKVPRRFIERTAKSTAGQQGVSGRDLRNIPVALPPFHEQRRIVTEVERRISVSDKMEATITESLQKAESLRQSILKKAFEGKLLSEKELEKARNAPDWEPAEKLLERIRQGKQIKEKNNKPVRRKTHGKR